MRLQQINPINKRKGKTTADRSPALRLSPKALDTNPTVVGPNEQPVSPAKASSANIAVPPFGHFSEARLKVPGHIAPTDNPHIPHPINERIATGERDAKR